LIPLRPPAFPVKFPIMSTDPLEDDTPSEEELETAAEELTGQPTPGTPADRIEALEKWIVYLQNQLMALDEAGKREVSGGSKVAKDLTEARVQLSHWQAQLGSN
jgi:hypothetical protein